MLRLHIRVNGLDMAKHIRQIQVRPWVVLALLEFLIDTNHECFRGSGTAEELKAKMAAEVQSEYGTEEQIPQEVLEEAEEQRQHNGSKKTVTVETKNATPGE